MKYTQRQWDSQIGWGKVPEEYKLKEKPMHPYFRKQLGLENEEMTKETKLEEYKRKINYDVWADVSNVKYNMKVKYNVQPLTGDTTGSGNRDNKS